MKTIFYGAFYGVKLETGELNYISTLRSAGAVCKKENLSFIWYANKFERNFPEINDSDIYIINGGLFPYQKEHVKKLIKLDRALLAIDTGLGKTVEMCAVLNYIYGRCDKQQTKLPSLVVAPKSILENWTSEIENHTNLTYGIFGDRLLKKKNSGGVNAYSRLVSFVNAEIQIISYSGLRGHQQELPSYEAAVFDEANYIKHYTTQVAKKAYLVRANRKYLLTATPIKNSPLEIYSLTRALDCCQFLFGNYNNFINRYADRRFVPFAPIPIISGYKNMDEIKTKISPFTIFEKKSNPAIAEQIGKVFKYETKVLRVEPTEEQDKINKRIISNLESLKKEIKWDSFEVSKELVPPELAEFRERILAYYTLARISSCSPSLLFSSTSKYVDEIADKKEITGKKNNKISEMLRIMSDEVQPNEKVVIYSTFVKYAKEINDRLIEGGFKSALATGENDYVDSFSKFQNDPSVQVLVMTGVGKYGINLQNASSIIFADIPFTYAEIEQTIGRIMRIGQKSVPVIYFLICGSIEEKIYEYVNSKKQWNEQIYSNNNEVLQ